MRLPCSIRGNFLEPFHFNLAMMWQPAVVLLLPTLLALPVQPECKLGNDEKPLEVVGTLKCNQVYGTKMGLFFNVTLMLGNLPIELVYFILIGTYFSNKNNV